MASLSDLIMQQVVANSGNLEIPSNVKDTVLNGLSSSILGSLTQTATKSGGLDDIKNLLTGKSNAGSSPITALASNLFAKNILSKLNLGDASKTALVALIPTVISKLSNVIKDQDGDGDVDLNDILLSLKGGGKSSAGSSLLGAATGILGSLFGKK